MYLNSNYKAVSILHTQNKQTIQSMLNSKSIKSNLEKTSF